MYYCMCSLFFFKASATTEIYTYLHTLSLHDSRPIAGTSRDGSRPSMHTLETGMSDPLDKKLPLDSWHRAKGARMVSFADYAMPIQYEGILAEHLWTRASAGLFDVSHMGPMELHGRDLDAALATGDRKSVVEGKSG